MVAPLPRIDAMGFRFLITLFIHVALPIIVTDTPSSQPHVFFIFAIIISTIIVPIIIFKIITATFTTFVLLQNYCVQYYKQKQCCNPIIVFSVGPIQSQIPQQHCCTKRRHLPLWLWQLLPSLAWRSLLCMVLSSRCYGLPLLCLALS